MISTQITYAELLELDRFAARSLHRFNPWMSEEDSVQDVSLSHGIDPEFVRLIVESFHDMENFSVDRYKSFGLSEVLVYLRSTHRYYLNKLLPEIEQNLIALVKQLDNSQGKVLSIVTKIVSFHEDLISHIEEEEKELFPAIEKLSSDGDVKEQIAHFMDDHKHHGNHLKEIRDYIYSMTTNEIEVLPFRMFLNKLEMLDRDLEIHSKMEDEVLMPLALESISRAAS